MAAVGGVAFYIVVPFLIYLASYLPYWWKDPTFGLRDWWDCQTYMYWYHSTLKATHPFESRWYTLLLDLRPVWYYKNSYLEAGLQGSIAGFYNPGHLLGGAVLHFAAAVAPGFGSRHGKGSGRSDLVRQPAAFLDAGIALHFHVPLLPQLGLCVDGHCAGLTLMKRAGTAAKKIGAGLCIAALVCFAWFYPVLSGLPVPTLWAQSTKILPSYGFY